MLNHSLLDIAMTANHVHVPLEQVTDKSLTDEMRVFGYFYVKILDETVLMANVGVLLKADRFAANLPTFSISNFKVACAVDVADPHYFSLVFVDKNESTRFYD